MMNSTMCEAVRPVQVATDRLSAVTGEHHILIQATPFKQNHQFFICSQTHGTMCTCVTKDFLALLPFLCLAAKSPSHDTKIPDTLHQLHGIDKYSTEFFLLCNLSFVKSLFHLSKPPTFWKESCEMEVKQTRSSDKANLSEVCCAVNQIPPVYLKVMFNDV